MRATVLLPFALCAAQIAGAEERLPNFSHDDALTCMAYSVVDVELTGTQDPAKFAQEMVFWSRLIAMKATEADQAAFETRFAETLAFFRDPKFEGDAPATPEEVDEILTGTAKMCWFEALAAEGGPYEGQ